MKVAKQKALVRVSTTVRKLQEKEGASTSTPKVAGKGVPKQKSDKKDDCPLKKGLGLPVSDKQSKKSLCPKPSHGASKGLMTAMGPITQGTVRCLLMYKEHAIEMVESIIKETNLGVSGLFDLSRVRFSQTFFHSVYSFIG